MKFAHGEDLAVALGQGWVQHRPDAWRDLRFDGVVPVPLHWRRRWHRGYNQAESLAQTLAVQLGKPCWRYWLWRTRHTPQQTTLSATERRKNIRGAFHVSSRAPVRGRTILLVDDVLTTGSTCSEAARMLRHAGAAAVLVAVLAKSG